MLSKTQKSSKVKQILYESGENLVNSIAMVLTKIGFKVEVKEREGYQDIEIEHKGFFGILEVKGKEGYANVDDLRQLLDFYINCQKEDESKKIKPIFIINHFRKKDIGERGEPFTAGALTLGTKNDFCLITTSDLFLIFNDFIAKKIKIDDVIEILNTNGLVQQYMKKH